MAVSPQLTLFNPRGGGAISPPLTLKDSQTETIEVSDLKLSDNYFFPIYFYLKNIPGMYKVDYSPPGIISSWWERKTSR